ncbi:MAG: hypothetical protein L6R36_001359 [Xanthoria steineri]|nr:MAG: hypothetical protein L6R36_001359 [Xanthoria steineri]
MLSIKLLCAAILASVVAAQNSTSGTSGNTDNTVFDVNSVDRTTRAAYADTFVSQTCQARFAACRQQNPGSEACITCGTLSAADVPMATSSMAAAASTAAADATSSAAGGAATGAAGDSQSKAGGPMIGGMEMVKGAVGLVAAMGLVL